MSEEEKEAVEELREFYEDTSEYGIKQISNKSIDIVLNLIEKQEKEYISKDKIRAKIKEKQDRINKLHPASDIVIIDDLENQINCYEELLGGK